LHPRAHKAQAQLGRQLEGTLYKPILVALKRIITFVLTIQHLDRQPLASPRAQPSNINGAFNAHVNASLQVIQESHPYLK
jgi:hypothetical protein